MPHGIQLTAMSETRSLRSLRVMPLPFRVKGWRAIHKKQIAVMAVMQFQTGHPPTIGRTANGIRCGIPSIEITCQVHALDPGRIAEKSHVMLLTSGGVRPLRLGGIAFASRRVHFFDCVFKFIIP